MPHILCLADRARTNVSFLSNLFPSTSLLPTNLRIGEEPENRHLLFSSRSFRARHVCGCLHIQNSSIPAQRIWETSTLPSPGVTGARILWLLALKLSRPHQLTHFQTYRLFVGWLAGCFLFCFVLSCLVISALFSV